MKRLMIALILLLPVPAMADIADGTNAGFVTTAPTESPMGGGIATGVVSSYSRAQKFTAPAGATSVTSIGWFMYDAPPTSSNFEVGLYADASGTPGELLGVSRTNATGTDNLVWLAATGLSIPVTAGTAYWIGVQVDTGDGQTYGAYKNVVANREVISSSATLPSTWSGGTASSTYLYAFYAVYETGGAATKIPVIMHHKKRSR